MSDSKTLYPFYSMYGFTIIAKVSVKLGKKFVSYRNQFLFCFKWLTLRSCCHINLIDGATLPWQIVLTSNIVTIEAKNNNFCRKILFSHYRCLENYCKSNQLIIINFNKRNYYHKILLQNGFWKIV